MTVATSEHLYLSTSDAARVLDVSPDSVRVYERTGRLPAIRTAGGIRLFRAEDVERLRQERTDRREEGS